MAANSYGPKNQPRFTDGGAPDTAVDPTLVSDYAAKVGNRRVGTKAEREAATGADVWEGLEWKDTTDGGTYERRSGAWVLVNLPWTDYTPTFTNYSFGTGALNRARYMVVNREVHVEILVTHGGSGAFTGNLLGSLPLPIGYTPHPFSNMGMGTIRNGGTSALVGITTNNQALNQFLVDALNATGTYVTQDGTSASKPVAIGTGATLTFRMTYALD